uniref:uncharacterized protein LOC120344280 n=1 Tax=Styela clava TaxID=7725 RepID=UPI00193945CD|nr:uncharacterized protein LOC120344280 [Styela clava]
MTICRVVGIFVIVFIIARHADGNTLQCTSSCSKNGSIAVLSNSQQLTCSIRGQYLTPWPKDEDKTAHKARKLKIRWYIYQEARIALDITWSQKVSDLRTQNIEGYYLTVGMSNYKVLLSYENKTHGEFYNHTKKYVNFGYQCIGMRYWFIRPGDYIEVKLHSLPMYHTTTNMQALKRNITIPKCIEDERLVSVKNKEISDKACKDFWRSIWNIRRSTIPMHSTFSVNASTHKPVIVHMRKPDQTIYFVLASVIGAFLFLIILARMVIQEKRNKNRKHSGERRILVIADNSDNSRLDEIHSMIARLRHEFNLQIASNWENRVIIGKDWMDWYQQAMSNSNTILFIVSYKIFCDSLTLTKTLHSGQEIKQAFKSSTFLQDTRKSRSYHSSYW